jgi:hypothetical protein
LLDYSNAVIWVNDLVADFVFHGYGCPLRGTGITVRRCVARVKYILWNEGVSENELSIWHFNC